MRTNRSGTGGGLAIIRSSVVASSVALGLVACAAPLDDGDQTSQAASTSFRRATAEVALGDHHTCVVARGSVRCWGWNDNHQATPPTGLKNPRGLALGRGHSCAITDDGVVCWGNNDEGQTTPPANLHNPKQLSLGMAHTCALDDDGIKCWGWNHYGQTTVPTLLGRPKAVTAGSSRTCALYDDGVQCWGGTDSSASTPPADLHAPTQLGAGYSVTCVLDVAAPRKAGDAPLPGSVDPDQIRCWGNATSPPAGLKRPTELAVGVYDACALHEGGITCWPAPDRLKETPKNLQRPRQLDIGVEHGCVLDDNDIVCWGSNDAGQTRVPSDVELVGRHACALANSEVRCVGDNERGQLGIGNDSDRPVSIASAPAIDLGRGFDSLAEIAYGRASSCARSAAGVVKCWGFNEYGQLGLGDRNDRGFQPGEMGDRLPALAFGDAAAKKIAMGDYHACAVTGDGSLYCWGHGTSGQLGTEGAEDVGTTSGPKRALLRAGVAVRDVALGKDHTCALGAAGEILCFGSNASGQLGTGSPASVGDRPGTMGAAMTPVNLGSGFAVKAIAAGQDHTCVLSTDGRVKCWGANAKGQLGLGDTESRGTAPEQLGDALPTVDFGHGQIATSLACGSRHCCVRTVQNTMKCWGDNADGQLGLGDVTRRGAMQGTMGDALPFVLTPPHEAVSSIDLHGERTCARSNSGLRCWGHNREGELGYGDLEPRGGTQATVPRLLSPLGI